MKSQRPSQVPRHCAALMPRRRQYSPAPTSSVNVESVATGLAAATEPRAILHRRAESAGRFVSNVGNVFDRSIQKLQSRIMMVIVEEYSTRALCADDRDKDGTGTGRGATPEIAVASRRRRPALERREQPVLPSPGWGTALEGCGDNPAILTPRGHWHRHRAPPTVNSGARRYGAGAGALPERPMGVQHAGGIRHRAVHPHARGRRRRRVARDAPRGTDGQLHPRRVEDDGGSAGVRMGDADR